MRREKAAGRPGIPARLHQDTRRITNRMAELSPSSDCPQFPISRQPDDSTCGPTCLHAVYHYYGSPIALDEVIAEVPRLENGGTLGVLLACHALRRGYRARIYTYNLRLFDPSWFAPDSSRLRERLIDQARVKSDPRLQVATKAYLEFFDLGGELFLEDLSPQLLFQHLGQGRPVLAGLSATWLYRCKRETGHPAHPDDLAGTSVGHFVVLCGIRPACQTVWVADPLHPNPAAQNPLYQVGLDRLLSAILLGTLTYDGNLIVLTPSCQ